MSSSLDLSPTGDQFVTLRELEDRYIHEVLNATGQNKTHAARILGIHPTSLLRRLKKTPELVSAATCSLLQTARVTLQNAVVRPSAFGTASPNPFRTHSPFREAVCTPRARVKAEHDIVTTLSRTLTSQMLIGQTGRLVGSSSAPRHSSGYRTLSGAGKEALCRSYLSCLHSS